MGKNNFGLFEVLSENPPSEDFSYPHKTLIDYIADILIKLGCCCGHVCNICKRHGTLHKDIKGFLQTKDDKFICSSCCGEFK